MSKTLRELLDEASPEEMQKMAEEVEQDFLNKIIASLEPLLEKQAESLVDKVLDKLASIASEDHPSAEPPVTAAHDNSNMGTGLNQELDRNEIVMAIQEAIAAGSVDKIVTFVKALAGANPEGATEVIKIVKVEMHDAVMNKKIDQETAVGVVQQISSAIGGE